MRKRKNSTGCLDSTGRANTAESSCPWRLGSGRRIGNSASKNVSKGPAVPASRRAGSYWSRCMPLRETPSAAFLGFGSRAIAPWFDENDSAITERTPPGRAIRRAVVMTWTRTTIKSRISHGIKQRRRPILGGIKNSPPTRLESRGNHPIRSRSCWTSFKSARDGQRAGSRHTNTTMAS